MNSDVRLDCWEMFFFSNKVADKWNVIIVIQSKSSGTFFIMWNLLHIIIDALMTPLLMKLKFRDQKVFLLNKIQPPISC